MTITNNERREVAEDMRKMASQSYPLTNLVLSCFIRAEKGDPASLWNRLADLIEPEPERMCHMLDTHWDDGQRTWGCICSECGAKHARKSGKWMNYCPNCGAKVTEVEE